MATETQNIYAVRTRVNGQLQGFEVVAKTHEEAQQIVKSGVEGATVVLSMFKEECHEEVEG